MSSPIVVPRTFLEMPRWWHEGQSWLSDLPDLVQRFCGEWNLEVDGTPMHGSNALVVPVRRDQDSFALRLTMPDDRTKDEIRALQFWDGRGTVKLFAADPAAGVSLLERLIGETTLAKVPLSEAVPVIARLMRKLAVSPPPDAPTTTAIVRTRISTMEKDWERLNQPFDRFILDAAIAAGRSLGESTVNLAVNGDLHFDQVLRSARDQWLVVDPVLMRGDIEYDLARILWSRLDEMVDDRAIDHWFGIVVREAELEIERATTWVIYRTVDYWLWGLGYGLTEDPVRCARLTRRFLGT